MSSSRIRGSRAAALAAVKALMAGTELHFDAITALVAAQIAVKIAMTAMQGAEAKVGPTVSAYRRSSRS